MTNEENLNEDHELNEIYCAKCDTLLNPPLEETPQKQAVLEFELADNVDQNDLIQDERDPEKMKRRQRFLEERIARGEDGVDIYNMLDEVSDM